MKNLFRVIGKTFSPKMGSNRKNWKLALPLVAALGCEASNPTGSNLDLAINETDMAMTTTDDMSTPLQDMGGSSTTDMPSMNDMSCVAKKFLLNIKIPLY